MNGRYLGNNAASSHEVAVSASDGREEVGRFVSTSSVTNNEASGPGTQTQRQGPPSPLCGFGAASSADQRLARFTEPKLAEGERRMVDQTGTSWNPLISWLRHVDALREPHNRLSPVVRIS